MGNAMALFYSHHDEDYIHVHIVASKINPDTGRAYDLAGSWRKGRHGRNSGNANTAAS